MLPRHAVVMDRDGDLWTCPDEAEDRWYCATQHDTHGVPAEEMLAACGPLDVLVHRHRIEAKEDK
ncbi:hypothetical protein NCCP2495_05780 [Dietzia sp. NCCP-2495]|uniref:hypothetical protein n=1 Tax=Dietzia sp. NCCP-2495 TaxID=2934675 RepID=UPI00222EC6FB|nr:hypothetical protein [Dietzia sp. NCCP-2495]GLB62700.1 hypothetical protein NCCP2495_05780 [Dietzia sp. NCCP-2495]